MAPQFVDFNSDGHVDIFTGTFDGSPHVAFGSADGFQLPHRILDAHGERVLLTQFWNYETEKWDDTERAIEDNTDGQLHCISAVAFDWDNDGDFDVLMGDKNRGRLFRQMNEGSNAAPAFTGKNIPVLTGEQPFELKGGMTAPYLVDWDADGLTDLVCGSFGDSYGNQPGGGIYWYRNTGKIGEPHFGRPVTLIEPGEKKSTTATRPDSGLYVDVVDYNGDGLLDLVVGGYSHWSPGKVPPTPELQQHIADLETQVKQKIKEINALRTKVALESKDLPAEERSTKLKEFYATDGYREQMHAYTKVAEELAQLKPQDEREAFVWVYLRAEAAKQTAAR